MLAQFFQMALTIVIIIDPIGIVPLFISSTGHLDPRRKRATIRKAISVAAVVLSLFILAGRSILSFFAISPGAFYIAGGIVFFMISLDMLLGQKKRSKTSDAEHADEEHLEVAVFPLAIPMIAGPGTITTLMLYTAGAREHLSVIPMLFGAVALALALVWAAMRASSFLLRVLGKTGVSVIERIMGLVLSGLAVQFVYDGLEKLGLAG
ncbi:MAG: MarC family protein [Spirochaetales bacterium]|nr:MarC family protein [Spirochaetales bacterium]